MRRRVILLCVLCLSAGAAFAVAQALHLGLRVDAVFGQRATSSSVGTPFAAVDTSPAKPSSERDAPVHEESSQAPASSTASDQPGTPKSDGSDVSTSDGVKLDLAQISRSGSTSVFAGRAAPGASVTVFDGGTAVASATANANGDWSVATDHKFAGPDPKFSLRAGSFKIAEEEDRAPSGEAKQPSAPGPVAEDHNKPTSPSRELLKNFESKVAVARQEEEASHQVQPTSAAPNEPPPPAAPASATPSAAPAVSGPTSEVTVVSPSSAALKDADHPQSASIPVPMTFVFDEATLTSDGEKTARLLLEYLQLKKFTAVTLSGHADERGTAEYNMDLSRKRLETVQAFLRSGGYQGKLDLVPKGASEPFTGVDRTKYSQDDLMQLDRRVEVRNAM